MAQITFPGFALRIAKSPAALAALVDRDEEEVGIAVRDAEVHVRRGWHHFNALLPHVCKRIWARKALPEAHASASPTTASAPSTGSTPGGRKEAKEGDI